MFTILLILPLAMDAGKYDHQNFCTIKFPCPFFQRTCPGSHIALSLLFLTAATILSVFEISEELDENGSPVRPKIDWTSAVIKCVSFFSFFARTALIVRH